MKRSLLYVFVFIFLISCYGCVTTMVKAEVTEANLENIARLSVGMSKREVSKVMVDKTYRIGGVDMTAAGAYFSPMWTIKNPFKVEILEAPKQRSLEVRYYVTSSKKKTREFSEGELTPLVFEKEKLIGWGWDFLNTSMKPPEVVKDKDQEEKEDAF